MPPEPPDTNPWMIMSQHSSSPHPPPAPAPSVEAAPAPSAANAPAGHAAPLNPRYPVQLAPEVREQLARQFDVDALEELLGTMPVEERAGVLESFGVVHDSDSQAETEQVSIMVWSSDPARQALLDRVWAPFWDTLPPEYLERTDLPYPGRELARLRRASEPAP